MSGYALEKVRSRWNRWEDGRHRSSLITQWVVTEPDGYLRGFDLKAEAIAWIAEATASDAS